jgi:hypothetical protein
MHAPSDNLDEETLIAVPDILPTDTQPENPETAALLGSIDSGTPALSNHSKGFTR